MTPPTRPSQFAPVGVQPRHMLGCRSPEETREKAALGGVISWTDFWGEKENRRWWVGSLEPATSRGDFDSGKTIWPVLSLEANGEMGEVFAARGQRGREACGKPQFLIKDVLREGRGHFRGKDDLWDTRPA